MCGEGNFFMSTTAVLCPSICIWNFRFPAISYDVRKLIFSSITIKYTGQVQFLSWSSKIFCTPYKLSHSGVAHTSSSLYMYLVYIFIILFLSWGLLWTSLVFYVGKRIWIWLSLPIKLDRYYAYEFFMRDIDIKCILF